MNRFMGVVGVGSLRFLRLNPQAMGVWTNWLRACAGRAELPLPPVKIQPQWMFEHELWTGAVRGFFPNATRAQGDAMTIELARHGDHPDRFVDSTWRLFGVEADFDRLKILAKYTHALITNRRLCLEATFQAGVLEWPAVEVVGLKGLLASERWRRRWLTLGGSVVAGRLMALRNDPILGRLSMLGLPWPPFDPELDHGWRFVSRKDAMHLGVLKPRSREGVPEIPTIAAAEVEARFLVDFGGVGAARTGGE